MQIPANLCVSKIFIEEGRFGPDPALCAFTSLTVKPGGNGGGGGVVVTEFLNYNVLKRLFIFLINMCIFRASLSAAKIQERI